MSDSIVADIPMNVKPVINIKNRGFRFVKFKSNGTKAKKPLEQIQKTQGAKQKKQKKKEAIFLVFLGVLHGFFRKSNKDEFSRKSNGGWIFLGITWGLQ